MNTNQSPSTALTLNILGKVCAAIFLWLLTNPDAHGLTYPINGWDTRGHLINT